MHASQGEGQHGSGDGVDLFSGSEGQNSRNLELIDIDFGNRDLTLGPIRDVFVPVGKLKRQAVISGGKRKHAFVGEGFVLNILEAALVERIAEIFLGDENQLIAIFVKNLNPNLQVVHQAVVLGGDDAEITGRLEGQGIIEPGEAAFIADGQENDVQIVPLKNHAGADLLAVHPLAANVVAIGGLLGEALEHHDHDVGSEAGAGVGKVHRLTRNQAQ